MPIFLSNDELDQLKVDYPEYSDECPTCHGDGHFTFQGQRHACLCPEQKRLYTRYLYAGIGLPYQRLMWSDLVLPGTQLDPATDYLDNAAALIDRGMGLLHLRAGGHRQDHAGQPDAQGAGQARHQLLRHHLQPDRRGVHRDLAGHGGEEPVRQALHDHQGAAAR